MHARKKKNPKKTISPSIHRKSGWFVLFLNNDKNVNNFIFVFIYKIKLYIIANESMCIYVCKQVYIMIVKQ